MTKKDEKTLSPVLTRADNLGEPDGGSTGKLRQALRNKLRNKFIDGYLGIC